MLCRRVGQARGDRIAKLGKLLVIVGAEALRFDECPETFDEIQIGRVGRQKEQGGPEGGGFVPYEGIAVIGRVIQDHGEGKSLKFLMDHGEQCGHRSGVEVAGVGECVIRDCRQSA